MKKTALLVYGLIAYCIFLGSFIYFIAFLEDIIVPKTINTGDTATTGKAVLVDFTLLTVFALQHSIMARPGFKQWWTRIIPPVIERSTYVLLSSLTLLFICWKWVPMKAIVWQTTGVPFTGMVYGISLLGWLLVLFSTLMISHFELFGLKQVFDNLMNRRPVETPFTTNIFYSIVRHPLMLGFLLAFWAAPVMTLGHLFYAIVSTFYIVIAVKYLEEKELLRIHGEQYRQYKTRVPMFIPFTKLRK